MVQQPDGRHQVVDYVRASGRAWQRAQFFALRTAFSAEWQPTKGGEQLLVDMLAQAYASWLTWLEQLQTYTTAESEAQHHKHKADGY